MLKSKQSKRFAVCMFLVVALLVLTAIKPLIAVALVLVAMGGLIAALIIVAIWESCA